MTDRKEKVVKMVSAIGEIIKLKDGVGYGRGLRNVKAGEIVYITSQRARSVQGGVATPFFVKGLVLNLNYNEFSVILLNNESMIQAGDRIFRSTRLLEIPVSLSLFGHVINALAEFKTENKVLNSAVAPLTVREKSSVVEVKAAGIVDRVAINVPLRTGLKAVDSLVPIGRGQRELIIGDRQTGKTSIAIDVILNHTTENNRLRDCFKAIRLAELQGVMWFVYAAIGQKQSSVVTIYNLLKRKRAEWYTCIVAATAAESAPLQFLCPYTACTVGEYIRDFLGGHSTIIYDDLSKHAVAYRQMSLLLRRPPGREAFPGDVFYLHSRLLERAGALRNLQVYKFLKFKPRTKAGVRLGRKTFRSKKFDLRGVGLPTVVTYKRGTLTAFPIIETQLGDVSAYIPTNVISITDGQIFLETELFYKGVRPAINVGLSVSRVGSAAQPPLMKKVSGSLKMELAQYREVESFAKLGSSLDPFTQKLLIRGENLIEILKQNVNAPLTTTKEILSIFLGLGFSSSWLSQILTNLRFSRGVFITAERFNSSWFELFSTFSVSFKSAHVGPFIRSFLNFYEKLGLIRIFDLPYVEKLNSVILTAFPNYFFDDLTLMYLFEGCATRAELNQDKGVTKGGLFLTSLSIFTTLTRREVKASVFNKIATRFTSLPVLVTTFLKKREALPNSINNFFAGFGFLGQPFNQLSAIVKSFLVLFYSGLGSGVNKASSIHSLVHIYMVVGKLLSETRSVSTRSSLGQNKFKNSLLNYFHRSFVLPDLTKNVELSPFLNRGLGVENGSISIESEVLKRIVLRRSVQTVLRTFSTFGRKSWLKRMIKRSRLVKRGGVYLNKLSSLLNTAFLDKFKIGKVNSTLGKASALINLNLFKLKTGENTIAVTVQNRNWLAHLTNLAAFLMLKFRFSTELLVTPFGRKLFYGLLEIVRQINFSGMKVKGANKKKAVKSRSINLFRRSVMRSWFVIERGVQAVKVRRTGRGVKRARILFSVLNRAYKLPVRRMAAELALSSVNLLAINRSKLNSSQLSAGERRWEGLVQKSRTRRRVVVKKPVL